MSTTTETGPPDWMREVARTPKTGCTVEDYLNVEIAMRRGMGELPTTRPYWCFGDFVLHHGVRHASKPLTADERALLAPVVERARKTCERLEQPVFALKGCFLNAAVLMHCARTEAIRYHEGYAYCGTLVTLHAWVTVNGNVVDLTWGPKRNGHVPLPNEPMTAAGWEASLTWDGDGGWEARVLGDIPEGWVYYGIDLTDELWEADSFGGSLIDNYEEGWPLLQRPRKTA